MQFSREIRLPTNVTSWTDQNEGAERLRVRYLPTQETQELVEEMGVYLNCSWKIATARDSKLQTTDLRRLSEVKDADNSTRKRNEYGDFDELKLSLNFTEPFYVSVSPIQMDKVTIEVLPEMFKNEGKLNYTT